LYKMLVRTPEGRLGINVRKSVRNKMRECRLDKFCF